MVGTTTVILSNVFTTCRRNMIVAEFPKGNGCLSKMYSRDGCRNLEIRNELFRHHVIKAIDDMNSYNIDEKPKE